jgi:hypothetical protein
MDCLKQFDQNLQRYLYLTLHFPRFSQILGLQETTQHLQTLTHILTFAIPRNDFQDTDYQNANAPRLPEILGSAISLSIIRDLNLNGVQGS